MLISPQLFIWFYLVFPILIFHIKRKDLFLQTVDMVRYLEEVIQLCVGLYYVVSLISKLRSTKNVCIIIISLINCYKQQIMIPFLYNVLFNLTVKHSYDCLSAVARLLQIVDNTGTRSSGER